MSYPPRDADLIRVTQNPELDISPRAVLAAFLDGKSKGTLIAYKQDLDAFRAFLGFDSVGAAAELLLRQEQGKANALVISFVNELKAQKKSAATINRRLAALRSLVKLARVVGLVSFTLDVAGVPDESYRDTRGPGREGVKKLLAQLAGRKDAKAVRDRALIHLLYDLALRRSEVLSLDREHIDIEQRVILVLGKGRLRRQRLTLPKETAAALNAWLEVRGDELGPLFICLSPAARGERLTGDGLYKMLAGLGRAVGLTVRPHGLRHAAITEALDATDGDVRAVQRFSRHKDVRVLCVYDDQRKDLGGEVARLVAKSST